MVSDSELVVRLREILRDSDLDKATAGSVRRQLEEDLGVDLSDRKAFVRDQIDVFLGEAEGADGDAKAEDEQGEDAAEEDEAENEEEEEDTEGKASKKQRSSKTDKGAKGRGGFSKLCALSPQLQMVTGVPHMARTAVVKHIWSYIKEKQLQNPKNKRTILCDDTLRALFRVDSIDMFQMNKALSKHIWALDEEGTACQKLETEEAGGSLSVEDASDVDKEAEEDGREEHNTRKRGSKRKRTNKEEKGVKKAVGGFAMICSLSEQLQTVMGVPELARTEVVKKLWSYIREKNLQDPTNKRNIICDESLRAIFEVDSIDMFQMNKALSKHIWPLKQEEALENSSHKQTHSQQARDEDEGCSSLMSS
ncbi:hypothetical protein SAY87_017789 [Trapa incisa]|uniref:Upstream activation factor subunit spp27 n=1 Tax=Trapa incisa TaxID=236973 RepID=A0AAN7QT84_9MYRT|nr:hypothetical protein SAY87_017789 [Trapa incisa]